MCWSVYVVDSASSRAGSIMRPLPPPPRPMPVIVPSQLSCWLSEECLPVCKTALRDDNIHV